MIKELNETESSVYQKNYISVLNWLSYFRQMNLEEEIALKRQRRRRI